MVDSLKTHHLNKIEYDPQFENFMYRVNEVNSIVKKLASNDEKLNEVGCVEADKLLKGSGKDLNNVDVDGIVVKVKNDKSLINHESLKREDDPATMSQEQFMKEVERDANQRYQDKLRRKERADTLKTQANKAFRRGEYEKALSCYNKALEYIKDSPLLYLNKALALINLKLYEEAIECCKTVLHLNENSLKAWLLQAKAHFLNGNEVDFRKCIQEAKDKNKEHFAFIEEYEKELVNMGNVKLDE